MSPKPSQTGDERLALSERTSQTDDQRIRDVTPLPPPEHLIRFFPIAGTAVEALIGETRGAIRRIMHGEEDRLLVVIGPCSIHDPAAALDYARALQGNTGHPQVRIRAGIHIGPMRVEAGDVFGGAVNFAARVVGAIKDAEIWLSERAKEDIDRLGSAKHEGLKWQRHEGVAMKGFPGSFTLWAVE